MAEPEGQPRKLRLAPGVRVVQVSNGIAFVSDHVRVRVAGPVATFFEQRLAPLLDGSRDRSALARELGDVDAHDLNRWLDRLVDVGVFDERANQANASGFLAALQLDDAAIDHLRARRIAIVGDDWTERLLASELANIGLDDVAVIEVGSQRPSAVATKEQLAERLAGADLVMHGGGTSRLGSAHWVNQIALATGLRALFTRIEAAAAMVGPLVLPGEGPCFLCWRMRELANSDDYEMAIAWESSAAETMGPGLDENSGFPMLPALVASVAAVEVAKVLAAVALPVTAGRVWEFNALTLETRVRPVLQRPDCPACRKRVRPPLAQPPIEELRGAAGSPDDLTRLRPLLVDDRTGIVRQLRRVPRDPTEPDRPVVVRAELSNHRFLASRDEHSSTASGKGMSERAAETSALGEALERYGAAPWQPDRVVQGRAEDLPLPAITPPALVLYADEQYEHLPYRRWSDQSEIGWVEARRAHDGARLYVPAFGTFLDYAPTRDAEFLYQVTSNGLAGGSSLAAAILSGLYEVLERDAFMLSWLRRLVPRRVGVEAAGDQELIDLATAYRRRGVELRLLLLPADHRVAVAAALGVDRSAGPDRPAVVVGLGADTDWRVAVRRAALEVGQVRPALRARLRSPETRARLEELLADPMRVADLEDHDLLYAHPSQLSHLSPWLDVPEVEPPAPATAADDPASTLAAVVEELSGHGIEVAYVNLTPTDIGSLGICVVRVLATELQPIHFGAHEARLGGRRLWTFGTAPEEHARSRPEQLNLQPHPLA